MPTTAEVNAAAENFIADTNTADEKINGAAGDVTDRHGVITPNLEKLLLSVTAKGELVFDSRSLLETASIPADVERVSCRSDNYILDFFKDVNGTALSTSDGANWSPLGEVSILHFGDKSASDNSPALQAAVNYMLSANKGAGGEIFIPAGSWPFQTEVTVNLIGITGYPNSNQRRVSIRGAGQGATVLKAQTAGMEIVSFVGDNPLTTASYGYMTLLKDLTLAGNSPSARSEFGVRIQDMAFCKLENVGFKNLATGLVLNGCLSSSFDFLDFRENEKGVVATGGASNVNANVFTRCEFGQLALVGYDHFDGCSNVTFNTCNFENCGTHGDAATGGAFIRCDGGQGEIGPVFIGCYIEGNAGSSDVQVSNTSGGTQKVVASFVGCNFHRISSTSHVTNCVQTSGAVVVSASGNSFAAAGTYTPDAARPYFNLGADARLESIGNRFEHAIEAPRLYAGSAIGGFVEGVLGASVTGDLPLGWSVSQISTGLFQVTHNFGHTDYALTATAETGNSRFVERTVVNANSFQVKVVRTADNVATDDDFRFVVVPYGGGN